MKKIIISCSILLISLFSVNGYAITLDDLQKQFSQHEVTRADFVQTRTISGLSKPLQSTGKMIISKTLGLWWQQQAPFLMVLQMNDKQMVQTIGGQKPHIITAEKQPQLFQFNSLLTAVFHADKAVLEENFNISLAEKEQQWQLILSPKTTPLNKIFKQIILTGKQYLTEITIDDMQSDQTVLHFINHRTSPLTRNEKKLFN